MGLTLSDVKLKAQIPLGECAPSLTLDKEKFQLIGLIKGVKVYIISLLDEVRDWNMVH